MDKLDFKKEYKDLYLPKQKPALVEVPPMRFLMVDGTGAPEDAAYQEAVQLLYSLAFTIKMSKMSGNQPEGYVEYVVPPLEGLWDCDAEGFQPDRHQWKWKSLLRQPDFVTDQVFAWACDEARKKKPGLDVGKVRLETYDEGLCVQLLHVGPYSEEQRSIDLLTAYIKEQGLVDQCGTRRWHHELYLGDPRRTAPERLKTVLRHPVARG